MRVTHLKNRDFPVSEAAATLAEALQPYLMTPVTAPDAVNLTGLSLEEARAALAYLAVRNAAQTSFVGDEVAYIFKHCVASIGGTMPSMARSFGRYLTDLAASQLAYLMGAIVVTGPVFIGATMVVAGMQSRDLFNLLAGGTILLGAMTVLAKSAIRSLTIFLPPAVIGGIALGWDRWSSGDIFWIPLAILVAVAMQAEILLRFRAMRPEESLRLLFWGRGFSEPLRDRKRLVELVTSLGGTVTVGDLIRTFGWTAAQAGEQLADILVEFGGDVAVDQDGVLYLRFDQLAESNRGAEQVPTPAYEAERKSPSPFRGLDAKWVFVIAVVCWIGVVTSPLNPIYSEFVKALDFTLSGFGMYVRMGFGALFTVPLFVYLGRLVLNLLERSEFGERREFLDALEYADSNAYGSFVATDKFSNKTLVDLNAEIDEERSSPGSIWVQFPDLQQDFDSERETVFDKFTYQGVVFDHSQTQQTPKHQHSQQRKTQ